MNVKTISYFCALILFTGLSNKMNAQDYVNLDKYQVLDSAYIKCSYKLTYLKDSTNHNHKLTDTQTLLTGKVISKYYSQEVLDWNHYIKANFENKDYPSIDSRGLWTTELFKNYPQGKETVTDIGSVVEGNYVYEEELPVFRWEISNERQAILSYSCQKATVSFRGRDFIAWFTTEIPVPNGPWKFGGLPGLILKLSDSKGHFIFECNGIEQLKKKEPIRYYQLNYTKISREDLNKLYQRRHKDFAAYNASLGIKTLEMDEQARTFKEVVHSSKSRPYNSIELE
jgi:GLPGLI family protein